MFRRLTWASPYLYNTRAEIDRLVESLDKISHLFHPGSGVNRLARPEAESLCEGVACPPTTSAEPPRPTPGAVL